MENPLDKYAWQARTLPALITLLPVGVAFIAWVPKAEDAIKPLVSVVVGAGALILVSHLSRDAGKAAQTRLLKEWGGWPTKTMLRHSDQLIDSGSKARYHARLQEIVPNMHIPNAEEEARDPARADEAYEACGSYLIAKTRDEKKFPLVLSENIGYGFRRNLYGLKVFGLLLSLAGAVGSAWKVWRDYKASGEALPLSVACLGICLVLLAAWAFSINARMVRRAAEDYARRVIASVDEL